MVQENYTTSRERRSAHCLVCGLANSSNWEAGGTPGNPGSEQDVVITANKTVPVAKGVVFRLFHFANNVWTNAFSLQTTRKVWKLKTLRTNTLGFNVASFEGASFAKILYGTDDTRAFRVTLEVFKRSGHDMFSRTIFKISCLKNMKLTGVLAKKGICEEMADLGFFRSCFLVLLFGNGGVVRGRNVF